MTAVVLLKPKFTLKDDFSFDLGPFGSDEEAPKCALISNGLSLALFSEWETKFVDSCQLRVNFLVYVLQSFQSDYVISLGCESRKTSQ